MKLIGLCGKARSGKDTIADRLMSHFGMATYAFADPLRRAAHEMFGVPLESFLGSNPNREEPHPFWGISPREMLQKLGSEGGRDVFGQDLWVRRAQQYWDNLQASDTLDRLKLRPSFWSGLVVTDIRYDNEAQWVLGQGGVVVEVKRPDAITVASHRSEQGIDDLLVTSTINNDGDLALLYRKINACFNQLL